MARMAFVDFPQKSFAQHSKPSKRCAGAEKEICRNGAVRCKKCNFVFVKHLHSTHSVFILREGELRTAQIKQVLERDKRALVHFEEGDDRTEVVLPLFLGDEATEQTFVLAI